MGGSVNRPYLSPMLANESISPPGDMEDELRDLIAAFRA